MGTPYIPRRQINTHPGEFGQILRTVIKGETYEGAALEKFMARLKEYLQVDGALPVSSGRFAMMLALKGMGIGPGDEVLTPAFSFKAVPATLMSMGVKPVFIEADPETFNMDIGEVQKKITFRTKAVIATHLFGMAMDIRALRESLSGSDVRIIEDCAHALGANVGGKPVGGLGEAGFFSFGTSKTLNTFGGGMLTTVDSKLTSACERLVENYPYPSAFNMVKEVARTYFYKLSTWKPFYLVVEKPVICLLDKMNIDYFSILRSRETEPGDFYRRFANLQAVVGLSQLDKVDAYAAIRRGQAEFLEKKLSPAISRPKEPKGSYCSYFMFAMTHPEKKRICSELIRRRIDVNPVYMHYCPSLFGDDSPYPDAKRLYEDGFFIQLGPQLTEAHLSHLVKTLNDIVVK